MAKVKFKATFAGLTDTDSYTAGQTYEVDEKFARRLVEADLGEYESVKAEDKKIAKTANVKV